MQYLEVNEEQEFKHWESKSGRFYSRKVPYLQRAMQWLFLLDTVLDTIPQSTSAIQTQGDKTKAEVSTTVSFTLD